MSLLEAVQSAIANLAKHKMRTALTMLGMIFGVGSVIAMLSIGGGAERTALEAIQKMGLNNVLVRGRQIEREKLPEVRKASLGVSLRDGEAISEAVPQVEEVLPRIEVKTWKTIAAGARTEAQVHGLSWKQPMITSVPMSEGRWFDQQEEADHAQVAVIGDRVRQDLFGFAPALGEQIKVNDVWLEVIGILGADEQGATGAASTDVPVGSTSDHIYIPFTTASRKFERDPLEAPVDELIIHVADGASTRRTAELVRPLLERLHAGADDWEIVVPEALLEQSRRTQRLFNIVMGSIAGISLLVGGIGIMNIMLASVLERTREIGVRRALGATQKDIRVQFVIESFAISVLGGATGIIIGILLARIVAAFAGWPTVVSLWSIVISTGVSMLVGWASGMYPANRAARLDPIEALRYE